MAVEAVSLVVDKLADFLATEVHLLKGIHGQIRYIKDELEIIKLVLIDAEAKFETDEQEAGESSIDKAWVKQVRELAFLIEDVIDEYTHHLARHRGGLLRKIGHLVRKLKERHEIASMIQKIKESVAEKKERCDRYRWTTSTAEIGGRRSNASKGNMRLDPRIASLFIDEAALVGIEHPKEDLVSRLVKEVEYKQMVISIVGMGGLGKTTLSKKIYDDPRVTAHFDCQAWITVSQSYKTDELLRRMIVQLHFTKKESMIALEGINQMEEVLLISKLRQYLAEKRYMVVFDDVWDVGFWEDMQLALPDNGKGSRIMFTTRNEDVAPSFKESQLFHVHKLESLPHDKAFELFCRKAFHYEGGYCPHMLEDLSHAIVERCGGLPLALVSIGGLLATKEKSVSEWQKLYEGLSSSSAGDHSLTSDRRLGGITRILSLSYHDLPYYLKPCFLYLGLFPEDHPISCLRLIRLWIAQGFIKEKQDMTLEDVAEEYLNELIHRSLLQVVRSNVQGKAKECRMHDFMREIVLSRSEELGLSHVFPGNDMDSQKLRRHLAICGVTDIALEGLRNSKARSLILFEVDTLPEPLIDTFYGFKLLKSLDFENAPLEIIPKELGNLWHLRYLSLRSTNVKVLPKSIGNLCNLETLDLRNTLIFDLPVEIGRLLDLRHLLAYFDNYDDEYSLDTRRGVKINGTIAHLQALQKLCFIESNHSTDLINELGRLTQLQKLGIKSLRTEDGLALCKTLEKMIHLRTLIIYSMNEGELLKLETMSSPPPLLQCLQLFGPLVTLPRWIPRLKDLVRISLSWSRLEHGIKALQDLPNLQEIWLYEAYAKEVLYLPKEGFGTIKVLGIMSLTGLKQLIIEDGAFPSLKELHLGPFPQLRYLPSINLLRNLKTLEFYDFQREFVLNMLAVEGPDNWKIKHIPTVLFHYKVTGVRHDTYKIGDPTLLKMLDV